MVTACPSPFLLLHASAGGRKSSGETRTEKERRVTKKAFEGAEALLRIPAMGPPEPAAAFPPPGLASGSKVVYRPLALAFWCSFAFAFLCLCTLCFVRPSIMIDDSDVMVLCRLGN